MPFITINSGQQLYYELQGQGEPLLLISGLGCDNSIWFTVRDELAQSFQVITFDNRDTGKSFVSEETYRIEDIELDAVQLLDHLSIETIHVAGHSMGGYIAQSLAINHPKRVKKLVLESTAAVSSARNNRLFADFFKRRTEMALENWMHLWTFWLFSPARFAEADYINNFMQAVLQYPYIQSPSGFKNQCDAIALFDSRNRLHTLKTETLVLTGRDDILITPVESGMLQQSLVHSKLVYVDNAGHHLHLEKPQAFTRAVLSFLKTRSESNRC